MKNQYKVISILASIMLSEGVFAGPSIVELSRQTPKSDLSMLSTELPGINKKADSIKKDDFVQFGHQLVAQSSKAKVEPPKAKVEPPKAKVEPPKAKVESPKAKVEPPKAKFELPKATVEPPKVKFEPISGPGSTLPPVDSFGTTTDEKKLTSKLSALYDNIEGASYGAMEDAIINVVLAAVSLTDKTILLREGSTESALKRKLSGYLKESALNEKNFKSVLKNFGVNIAKDVLVDLAINFAADVMYEATGNSLAAKESTWLALKHAAMYLDSGGNPVAIAVGEAAILQEVIVKDYAAYKEFREETDNSNKSFVIGVITSLISNGALEYAKGKDNLVSTRQAIEKAITDSGLDEKTENELKVTYLNWGGNGKSRVENTFDKVRENRDNMLEDLMKSGNGPEFEAFLKHYYPESKHAFYQNKFDQYNRPQFKAVEVLDKKNEKIVLGGIDEKKLSESYYFENPNNMGPLMDEVKAYRKFRLDKWFRLDKMEQSGMQMSVNNLNNSINDVNNGNKVRVTESNSTPPHENWWQGYYTKNYYFENNSGEPVINGGGYGPAGTQASKPGIGTVLYLDKSADPQGIDRKIALKNSASEYFEDYNYVAWGTWSDPNAVNRIYISHWVVVNQLDRGQVPHTGSASYKGELNGVLFNMGQANTIHNANGDITMDADFVKNTINGTLNVKNADNGAPFAEKVKFDTGMSSTTDGDGLKFQGALTGAGISNQQEWHSQITGEFGGNQAAEAGGTWSVTKGTGSVGDGRATGVFRAEKQ